jgi:hypothetical protein
VQQGEVAPEAHVPGLSLATIPIQPKLEVGQPDDEYEREADRIADQVMRMEEPPERSTVSSQRSAVSSQPTGIGVSPEVETKIRNLRGGGHPLSEAERAFFEPRFGFDFSKVRIHADERGARAAEALHARAFTVGNNIVFGRGEYAPETESGQWLLGHEMTHVAQQASGAVAGPQCKLVINPTEGKLYQDVPEPEKKKVDDVEAYLQELSPTVTVDRSGAKPVVEGPSDCGRVTDRCLCDMCGPFTNDWEIWVDDYEWPHTSRNEDESGNVVVQSTLSPAGFGAWGGGASEGQRVKQDRARILGHELCGHAWLYEYNAHPEAETVMDASGRRRMSRPGHDPTVMIENIITEEKNALHGEAEKPRGLFTSPHSGESFADIPIEGYVTNQTSVPPGMGDRLDYVAQMHHTIEERTRRAAGDEYDYTVCLDVVGRSDRTGPDWANEQVSKNRAVNVAKALQAPPRSIPPSRFLWIDGKSYEGCPESPTENAACRKVDVYMFGHKAASEKYPARGEVTPDVASQQFLDELRMLVRMPFLHLPF